MTNKEFLDDLFNSLDDRSFELLKKKIVGEYLEFTYINDDDINRNALSEKILDYFETLEIKSGDSTNVILQKYMSNMKNLVSAKIVRLPRGKKQESDASIPRARRYYEYAKTIRYSKDITFSQRVDFVRIILCLYMAIINDNREYIDDFDLSVDAIHIDRVLKAMKAEKTDARVGKKIMFDLSSKYSIDFCTMILTIMFYVYIKNSDNMITNKFSSED